MQQIANIFKPITTFFSRYHLVIVIVLLASTLSAVVVILYGVISSASNTEPTNNTTTGSTFDQATIDRIEKLKSSSEPSQPLDLSEGRINLFTE